jgi:hypothetical protein
MQVSMGKGSLIHKQLEELIVTEWLYFVCLLPRSELDEL